VPADISPSVAGMYSSPDFYSASPLPGPFVVSLHSAIFPSTVELTLPMRIPSSEVSHRLFSAVPPPSSPLNLAYRFPR
jgi:hypothetical protein